MTDDEVQPEDEGGGFSAEWAWYEPRKVLSDRKLRYPPQIQAAVCDRDAPKGPSVCWNYERNTKWIVISQEPLRDPAFRFAARNVIEQPDGEYTKIRARDELPDEILRRFYEGNYLIYLARHEMLDDNPSTWLLQRSELLRVLPGGGGDNSDVKKQLTRNPSFLSSL